ncbi:MAG: hypothetical protein K6A40_08495 [Solobacterium sp.]|nr:hypothetical protein [Solobacterium sp.]
MDVMFDNGNRTFTDNWEKLQFYFKYILKMDLEAPEDVMAYILEMCEETMEMTGRIKPDELCDPAKMS